MWPVLWRFGPLHCSSGFMSFVLKINESSVQLSPSLQSSVSRNLFIVMSFFFFIIPRASKITGMTFVFNFHILTISILLIFVFESFSNSLWEILEFAEIAMSTRRQVLFLSNYVWSVSIDFSICINNQIL